MNISQLQDCYNLLIRSKGWDTSNGQKTTKQILKLLKELQKSPKEVRTLPPKWYDPLLAALQCNQPTIIDNILNLFADFYCKKQLNFEINIIADDQNNSQTETPDNQNATNIHILVHIISLISNFSREIFSQSAISITRFALSVINGESDANSPVHGDVLLQYFQAIFNCTIFSVEKTAQVSSRTSLTQSVEIIAQRFESPPIYNTDISLLAYQIARKVTFDVLAPDLFDLLDNTSSLPKPSNIYECDALLILRTICSFSSSLSLNNISSSPSQANSNFNIPSTNLLSDFAFKESSILMNKALISIELVSSFVSYDHEIMYTSLFYLQIIKNFVCSLVLRYSHSDSHQVFKATLKLCHMLMMRYRDILKAESSVFFSSMFFRVLDQPSANNLDKLAVIDRLERFSPSFLAEIFVNFDCDIDLQEANVFEHLISSLITLSEYPESLQTLAAILKNLNQWSRQKEVSMKPTLVTSQLEKTKKLKALYSKAIDDFNADPEHNITSLIDSGLVKNDPKNIAAFFHSHRSLLSFTGVGLILGGVKPLFKQIMHEYIDMIDFSKMSLVEALYHFLSLFRLPPESQQIDRIIEKFAHTFYLSHQNEFPSASIVYDASFAAVILHTDAHNPQVSHKMQKNEFVKLYKDMDEGEALPTEFIESIYDYVVTHEIALLGSSTQTSNQQQMVTMNEDFRSPTQKGLDAYKQSLEHIKEAQKRMRNGSTTSNVSEIRWVCPVEPDTVRPMFEAVWMPLNALASKILSEGGSEEVVQSALTILTSSIDISARFFMETESTVCMSSLCTFTRLQPWTPIKIQNIRAIRELLDMSTSFSSYFEAVWEKMLSLFAQLNYFMMSHNSGSMTNDSHLDDIAQKNAEIVAEFVPLEDIDALFEASANFPSTAIIPFVHALCKVSNNEFGQRPPRTFCLQKIVEVTSFNMERARFVWTQIWKPISHHLIEAGCFPEEGIARSALDSLRQLSGKFLAREELQSYHYQRDFLKPFHSILRKSKSKSVRLHALRCLNHTVHLYHEQMKSGWEAAFSMLESAATIAEVNRLALTVLIDIFEQNLLEIIDEHLMEPAMKAVEKFSIIGRSITRSAVYVIAGIFEKMMSYKLDDGNDSRYDPELDFKPVLFSLVKIFENSENVSIVLPIISKSITKSAWKYVVPYFIVKVLRGKGESWLDDAGKKLVEWAVPACCEVDVDLGISLIVECSKVPNHKILSICASNLSKMLEKNDAAKEAATCIAKGIISSLDNDAGENNIELLSGLAADLAPCLQVPELKALEKRIFESLTSLLKNQTSAPSLPTQKTASSNDVTPSNNNDSSLYVDFFQQLQSGNAANSFTMPKNSIPAILSISTALLAKKEIKIDNYNYLCTQLFKRSEEGQMAVINSIMALDDNDFYIAGGPISIEAAKLISTNNEKLREILKRFFVRMSQDCFVQKIV